MEVLSNLEKTFLRHLGKMWIYGQTWIFNFSRKIVFWSKAFSFPSDESLKDLFTSVWTSHINVHFPRWTFFIFCVFFFFCLNFGKNSRRIMFAAPSTRFRSDFLPASLQWPGAGKPAGSVGHRPRRDIQNRCPYYKTDRVPHHAGR